MIEGYRTNTLGAIEQMNPGPGPAYDCGYVRSRYDDNSKTEPISRMRIDLLQRVVGTNASAVLDFGCGNWSFVRKVQEKFTWADVAGWDISGYPAPARSALVAPERWEVFDTLTCFDSLEHLTFDDAEEMLSASHWRHVMVSMPWCHARVLGRKWFDSWKHRRPNEHLFHLDHLALTELMHCLCYKTLFIGNPEDAIREPADCYPNILTGIFSR